MLERLQKILSARGIASRRKAEEYIERGLVTVNGKKAVIGQKADAAVDRIEVSGEVLEERQEMLYLLLNKPVGVVTSNVAKRLTGTSPEALAERTVRDLLPPALQGKVFPVGRLDKNSEGLLLLTNDGALANRLTHPKFDHEKEYEVETEKEIFEGALDKMRQGIKIMGEITKPAIIKKTGSRTFRIALTEGKNRQIRRMCQKVGNAVTSLKRIRIVSLTDTRLAPGKIRPLTDSERSALLASVGV